MQQRIAAEVLTSLNKCRLEHKLECSWKDLGMFIDLYLEACRKSNYVDFDRLLSLLVALMQHAPGVADKYRARYRCVCICPCTAGCVWLCVCTWMRVCCVHQ